MPSMYCMNCGESVPYKAGKRPQICPFCLEVFGGATPKKTEASEPKPAKPTPAPAKEIESNEDEADLSRLNLKPLRVKVAPPKVYRAEELITIQ